MTFRADMIKDLGCDWTILGHSERRTLFRECDETVARKLVTAVKSGLKVIVCVGESLEERESGRTEDVLTRQINYIKSSKNVIVENAQNWNQIVIAYEPIWAIGTGRVATSSQVQEAHRFIRALIDTVGKSVKIIYGGCYFLREQRFC
ncbi:LOW QUALITY PROTEIN: triosephosphate isomerase-like [Octopus sinensis]|uniref:Triosephosphate isomerase n=1 Tax=Octopus sinensis TaxID=2607531 RepID=A0A7E6EKD8_9MOLL|nr:LOW QUALITY PROTEIN: triosephosphate isomerase-like [Octopus sinensis]